MSRVILTDFDRERKIQAVKGFRSAFLGDLHAAKVTFDALERGEGPLEIRLPPGASPEFVKHTLLEHGVQAEVGEDQVPVDTMLSLLREFNPDLTVGALLDVLSTTDGLVRRGSLMVGGEW